MTEIQKIKLRNKQVEMDKAWETSFTRKIIIAIMTYIIIVIFLYFIDVKKPYLNAIVPVVGFLLSTLIMPWFKKKWIKNNY